jgi:NAD(P)-dependent dehydrogenase (short-subunit alcohol dehydrogenase family)
MNSPKRKTAVITGSTKGIGRAIAYRLLREHYNIVLNYASDDKQAQETFHIFQQESPSVILVKADISHKLSVEHLMQECLRTFQSIDVLINNAASVRDKPLQAMTEDDWDQVVNTNMKGTFLCSQVASHYMLEQNSGGAIINIGASTGIRGRKNGINTCASKAGIMVMTHCLALELGPKIRVNTVIPGLTRTEETTQRFHLDDPAVLRSRTDTIPLQRIGTPEDIADAVMLLLSEQAQFITGQKLVIDGGQYMW